MANTEGFDVKTFLKDNKEGLAKAALASAVKGNSKSIETLLKLIGELDTKKGEVVERSNADIARDSEKFVTALRIGIETGGGICPLLCRPCVLLDEIRKNQVH